MSSPARTTPPEDPVGWLLRKLRRGQLVGLPPYRPPGDPLAHRPEAYARRLLSELWGECPSDDPAAGAVRRIAEFRAWVESGHRQPAWTRRSHVDLESHAFGTLRTAEEIHRALETIARPEPDFTPFVVTHRNPAREQRERRALIAAQRARNRAKLARSVPFWPFIILIHAAGLLAIATGMAAGLPAGGALGPAVLMGILALLSWDAWATHRGWPKRRALGGLGDPWLDPISADAPAKGASPR